MAHFSISEPGPGTGTAARRAASQARKREGGGGTQGRKRTTVEEGTCYVGGLQNISKNVRKLQENEINEDGYAI